MDQTCAKRKRTRERERERERESSSSDKQTDKASGIRANEVKASGIRALALRRLKKSFVHSSSLLFRVLKDRQK
jgi:hypothetical protein